MRFLLYTLFSLLTFTTISAQEGFVIDQYEVEMILSESGEIKVIEDIDVTFTERRRGIFRTIPIRYQSESGDKRIRVTDVRVRDWRSKVYQEGNDQMIRIGDANTYVTGPQSYHIEYKVQGAIAQYEEHDEFYWNVIGTDWKVPMEKVSFSMRFPYGWKEKIEEFVTFNGRGGDRYQDIILSKEDNIFAMTEPISLSPGNGITVAFKVPKGLLPADAGQSTMTNTGRTDEMEKYNPGGSNWLTLIPAGIAMWLFSFWRRDGRRQSEPSDVPLRYHPPAGMSPAEVGTFYDYRVNRRDIISLLPYWGEKGYLKVKPISDDDVYFEKIRDIEPDEPAYAQRYFNDLFEKGDNTLLSSLQNKFYQTMGRAASGIMKEVKAQELYDATSLKRFHSGWMIAAFILALGAGIASMIIFLNFFMGIAFIILGVFCLVVHFLQPKLSDRGYEVHNHLRGLYAHLKNPNPEKLNELLSEDPNYLNRLFPYALAFGLDKQWEDFFRDWEMSPPMWYIYDGYGHGHHHHSFGQFTKDFGAHRIEKVFYSAPASSNSSGGGFSGGGSVGGGFGGGGGGSW